MATQRAFGRRTEPQKRNKHTRDKIEFATPAKAIGRIAPTAKPSTLPVAVDDLPSIDEELREWKRTRRTIIPWSQLSLMASLCFGIGSFVLPDSVNKGAQWLLWGLAAASAYAWFTNRRARSKAGPAS